MDDAVGEIGQLARATAEVVDAVAETVERTHAAVSARVFRAVGPVSAPVRVVTDATTRLSYRAVRGGVRATAGAVALVTDRHPRLRGLRPLETRRGRRALAAASGIVGDTIATELPGLDPGLELRDDHGPLPVVPGGGLDPEGRDGGALVVFVHGLCEDDRSWWRPSRAHRPTRDAPGTPVTTHAERLARAHGMQPLYVRYNTGRSVHHSGVRLAQALEVTVAAWPTAVHRLVLVGHSMGGLVSRAACHEGVVAGHAWPERLTDVVHLGTPHLGAPLAKAVDAAAGALGRVPETRGMTGLLERRSAGVRDLQGELLAADSDDPAPLAAPPGLRHHLVASTVTRSPRHPVGRLVGDTMVRTASASGRSRSRSAGVDGETLVLGGAHHFDLLSHPEVGRWLVDRLAP